MFDIVISKGWGGLVKIGLKFGPRSCEVRVGFGPNSDFSHIFRLFYFNSRAQLKRHTSSLINFSIDIQFISQKVNMPLLRLLNQIVTMHMNVKETNEELRENRPVDGATGSNPPSAKSSTAGQDPSPFIARHKRSSSGLYNLNSFKIYRKFKQFHQTCPDLSRLVQTCPDLSRIAQTCPDFIR